jgi:hypothetical protein
MKVFLPFCFFCFSHILVAQCPYKISIDVLKWEGETITLKWHSEPKPLTGEFDIFRTCLSLKNDKEKPLSNLAVTKRYEYSDTDRGLNGNKIYAYRVQLRNMPTCSVVKRTSGRVIEEDTLTTYQPARDLSTFTQKDVVAIKTQTTTTKTHVFLPIEIEIKDFKFPFTAENTVIETEGHTLNDDFRFANVFIVEHPSVKKTFRIALVQGNIILGMSGLIGL